MTTRPSLAPVDNANEKLAAVHSLIESILGSASRSVGNGKLTLRYASLPNGENVATGSLDVRLESLGAEMDYAHLVPVSLRDGGQVKLQCAGTLEGIRFLGSAGGFDGQNDVVIELYQDPGEANKGRDLALFAMADKLFTGEVGAEMLSRYVGHALRTHSKKSSKKLAVALTESIADYIAG